MQGVPWEKKHALELFRPAGFNEAKIELFVGPVDFVSDQGMSKVSEVDSDLVGAAGARNCPNDREFFVGFICPEEPFFDTQPGHRRGPAWMNDLLQPDGGMFVFALARNRRLNCGLFPLRPVRDKREIFLPDLAPLHCFPETAGGREILCDQNQPTGLAIEPIDD